MAECRGCEDWPADAVSHPEEKINVVLVNPAMVEAYRAGVPGNGKPFLDGGKTAKIHSRTSRSDADAGPLRAASRALRPPISQAADITALGAI